MFKSLALVGAVAACLMSSPSYGHGIGPMQYKMAVVQNQIFVLNKHVIWIVVRKNGEIHGWDKLPVLGANGDWPEYSAFTIGQWILESNSPLQFTPEAILVPMTIPHVPK